MGRRFFRTSTKDPKGGRGAGERRGQWERERETAKEAEREQERETCAGIRRKCLPLKTHTRAHTHTRTRTLSRVLTVCQTL